MTLRLASILGPHFGDRLSYGFLNLFRGLVSKRPPEALQNRRVPLPPRIHFSHATYLVRTVASLGAATYQQAIAPAVPSTFRTTTSNSPTIHVLRFATSAFVA